MEYSGLSQYLESIDHDQNYIPTESTAEKQMRKSLEKKERIEALQESLASQWDPSKYENVTEDSYKTLFLSNLDLESTEKQIRKAFDVFGEIKSVIMISDKNGKSKGYAFVEFERESGMKLAYKEGNGLKLNSRRVLVDVERGRTVKDWKPKKLGGGLGKKRFGDDPKGRTSKKGKAKKVVEAEAKPVRDQRNDQKLGQRLDQEPSRIDRNDQRQEPRGSSSRDQERRYTDSSNDRKWAQNGDRERGHDRDSDRKHDRGSDRRSDSRQERRPDREDRRSDRY